VDHHVQAEILGAPRRPLLEVVGSAMIGYQRRSSLRRPLQFVLQTQQLDCMASVVALTRRERAVPLPAWTNFLPPPSAPGPQAVRRVRFAAFSQYAAELT
jgi:hypothetical protein